MQTADILKAQKGDTQTWASITGDGDGKFDFSTDLFINIVEMKEGESSVMLTINGPKTTAANLIYGIALEIVNDNKDLQATFKLLQIDIKEGDMYSLIGNIGGYNADTNTTEYINLTNGFTGAGGIFFQHDATNDDKTEIYFGGTNNTYTGTTEIDSNVTVHLQNKDSISHSQKLILHGGANLIIDDPTADYTFDNFDKVILMGVSNADPTAQTKTVIDGGGSTISLSGAGKQFNFFQEESILGSGSNTPDTTPDTTPETPETTTPETSEDTATAEAAGPVPANLLFAKAPVRPCQTLTICLRHLTTMPLP